VQVSDLDYALPPECVAQVPAAKRTDARLLLLDRAGGTRRHAYVRELPGILRAGDLLVLNDSRVRPARMRGQRRSGGRLEVLFVAPGGAPSEWEVLVRGRPRVEEHVDFAGVRGQWLEALGDGRWRLRVEVDDVPAWLERRGEIPLPPYIHRNGTASETDDRDRYQTVYARVPGSVAAPTAGLHFTAALLAELAERGVRTACLTLHVGPGTFLPVRSARLEDHRMLPERFIVTEAVAREIGEARQRGGRVVAVGTTTVRALEAAAGPSGLPAPGEGVASLFVTPGFRFRVVDALLTNFHLPRSTLLALVAAFAGWEAIRTAYAEAIESGYRFYSYGDAMLIE
jgi:S-adenosylmethionine:tRNA ribosyltransferase-isomerase